MLYVCLVSVHKVEEKMREAGVQLALYLSYNVSLSHCDINL